MQIKVLYHSPCNDGTASALAAWMALGDRAEYIPCQYGQPLPYIHPGDRVYFVDFSAPRSALIDMAKVAEKVVVLDHHKTAQADLEGLEQENPEKFNIIFDMARSGAGLAWQFFHPFSDLPDLLAHIQDRDLWQFKLEGTKEIHAALGMYPREFSVWEGLLGKVDSLKKEGAVLLRKQEMEVEAACRHAKDLDILGYNAIAINSTVHQSEIGNKLCKQHPDHPFAAIYTIHDHEDVRFGLRSIGDFDVSAIAQKFGGGGHKNAAGFQVSLGKFLAGL